MRNRVCLQLSACLLYVTSVIGVQTPGNTGGEAPSIRKLGALAVRSGHDFGGSFQELEDAAGEVRWRIENEDGQIRMRKLLEMARTGMKRQERFRTRRTAASERVSAWMDSVLTTIEPPPASSEQ